MSKINIEASIHLATQDFKIIGDVDYLEFGAGMCCEGHSIRYGIEVEDENGEIYVFGSQCIAKPFILKHWNLKPEMLDNEDVIRAGKYLWVIKRDDLLAHTGNIPTPEDVNFDFKLLKEKLKVIVRNAKKGKRAAIKKLMREERMKDVIKNFNDNNLKQVELIKKLREVSKNSQNFNEWECEFIMSVFNQNLSLKKLSDKQLKIIERLVSVPEEADSVIGEKLKKISNIKTLDDWSNNFVISVRKQYQMKGTLSEKQINLLDKILKDNTTEYSEYIGAEMSKWITNEKSGIIDSCGKIVKVIRVSEKAILANFAVNDIIFKEIWIPKSQLELL